MRFTSAQGVDEKITTSLIANGLLYPLVTEGIRLVHAINLSMSWVCEEGHDAPLAI